MTSENIRFGFARIALVAAWAVAIPWTISVATLSPEAFQTENWDWFKWDAIMIVPVCKLVSWSVKIAGWIIRGFLTPPHLDVEQQAFRLFAQYKAILANIWLIVSWFLVWEAADLAGKIAPDHFVAGRVSGLVIATVLLGVATFILDAFFMDEILIRLVLKPNNADYGRYVDQNLGRGFGMPFR
jgi:hypothetical protein